MSRLAEMQARFQQRQMQEKEEKLLRLYETQQQRAFERVSRGSSGGSSVSGGASPVGLGATAGAGRVRQMFDERRQKAGIDRSYPLEPLKQTTRLNGHVTATRVSSLDRSSTINKSPSTRQTMTVKTSVQRTMSHSNGGGKPQIKSRSIRQTSNSTYANGRLVEENSSYEENDNDHAINMLNQQQRELEMMMNNHNLNDSLEDEELPNVGIDEVDESRDSSPYPNENDNYLDRKSLSNGSYVRDSEVMVSSGNTPTKKAPASRISPASKPAARKPIAKLQSTSRTTSPRSAERPVMKNTTSVKQGQTTARTGASMASRPPTTASRAPVAASRTPTAASRSTRGPPSASPKDGMSSCKFCQRNFASDRLATHEDICGRTAKKKRKAYDAVKHRVQGTEVEGYLRKGPKGTSSVKSTKQPQMPKTDWRRQHEEFISAIRAAKMAQAHIAAGGKLSDLPPPPPSLNPDYVQCPHCGRRFNESAAARHIPKCATMLHNKPNRVATQPKKKY